MDFDWKGVLRTVAPGLATAFGGPLAGMAVAAVGNALGLSEPTQEKIEAALVGATPADLLTIKKAEQEFVKAMKTLDIDLEKVHAGDRDSARKMQTETKSNVPALLAALVTTGFFGVLGGLLTGQFTTRDTPEMLLLIGSLSTSWGMVVSFYFGSSSGSQGKDATIRGLVK